MVIIGVLGLLAVLLLVPLAKAKAKAPGINCTNNLKQVGLAFRMWSDDNGVYPMRLRTKDFDGPSYAMQQKMYVYFQTMSNELNTPKIVVCPGDNRNSGTNFTTDFGNLKVSYFVGMDTDETKPRMFLSGDRNLALNNSPIQTSLVSVKSTDKLAWMQEDIHHGQGNVGLADGSVRRFPSSGLQPALSHTGTNVNRLALP